VVSLVQQLIQEDQFWCFIRSNWLHSFN